MPDPKTYDEYLERYQENSKVEGHGAGSVFVTAAPCPFCAAPDWLRWDMMEVREAMEAGAVCIECKRGCRAIFDTSIGGVAFEFVQTCGPDPAEWLTPKMRRVV